MRLRVCVCQEKQLQLKEKVKGRTSVIKANKATNQILQYSGQTHLRIKLTNINNTNRKWKHSVNTGRPTTRPKMHPTGRIN